MSFYSINAEETSERAKLEDRVSAETGTVRAKAVRTVRLCVQSDPLVGVKLFKMRILSNLITHTLKDCPQKEPWGVSIRSEVKLLAECLKNSPYREQLVVHSTDFKEERKRLQALADSGKTPDQVNIDPDLKKLLSEALKVK